MNIRFSVSLSLVLLSQFFYRDRNFPFAVSFFVQSDLDRHQIVEKLPDQFAEGRMVFTSWYWHESFMKPLAAGVGGVILAGETEEKMWETVEELWAVAVQELEY